MADSTQPPKDQTSPPVEPAQSAASVAAVVPAPTPEAVSDAENQLTVYVYQSKFTQPTCIKNLVENLSKQKEAGTLGFNFHSTDSAGVLTARLTATGYGIAVISVHDEKEMQQAHLVLGKLSSGINTGLIRVLIVNKFNESKTLQNLKVRGAYEILDFGMNVKSLTFKMNNAIKLTESQFKRTNSSKAKSSSTQDSAKGAKKSRIDNTCVTVHEKSDEHVADFWILSGQNNIRYVMGRVVVELLGPGPVSGQWTRAESVRNDEQGWVWSPRKTEETPFFSAAEGRWIFYGRQPDFSWQSYLWNFVSKAPFLAFYQDGVPEPVTIRFQKDSPNQFKIKKNVTNAQQWMVLIKETIEATLKQKDSLVGEKAASDYNMKTTEDGPSAKAKDFVDHGDPESKELSGKFSDEKSDTGAEDYLNESADESKELSISLQNEKAREMRNHASQNPEPKSAFNLMKESSSEEDADREDGITSEAAAATVEDDSQEESGGIRDGESSQPMIEAQALDRDSNLSGKKQKNDPTPVSTAKNTHNNNKEAGEAQAQSASGLNAARAEMKKKIAELKAKKASGAPLSQAEAKALEEAETAAGVDEASRQEKKSTEKHAHTQKNKAQNEARKHDLKPDAAKGAFNVGDLAQDEKKNFGQKSAKNSHFEIYLIGKNGSPLPKPVPLQLIEIGEVTLLVDIPDLHFGIGESAQIRVRYVCEPEVIAFDAATEVKSFDGGDDGSALAALALDPKSILKMNQITAALAARRELMADFFRMARGEDVDEQFGELQKAA